MQKKAYPIGKTEFFKLYSICATVQNMLSSFFLMSHEKPDFDTFLLNYFLEINFT